MPARSASTHLGEGALGEDAAEDVLATGRQHKGARAGDGRRNRHVHEQTGLSTGAVTDNNELSSNLGHGGVRGRAAGVSGRWVGAVGRAEGQQVR